MLFDDVRYYLSESLTADKEEELVNDLDTNGGKRVKSFSSCTHVITNSSAFEGYKEVGDSVKVVSELWVTRSVELGKAQNPDHYSADPGMIFSGVVACAVDLLPVDLEVLSAGIGALGGQWRSQYTKDVTHLFTLRNDSPAYNNAMEFREQTDLKVVTPHWFDDSIKLGVRDLDATPYEWPDPPVMRRDEQQKQDVSKKAKSLDPEKEALFRTAAWSEDSDIPTMTGKPVFGGRRILLSSSLELGDRRVAVEVGIKRAAGKVVKHRSSEEEVDKVDGCDIFITKSRSGAAYYKAVKVGKTVGTLQWLFHVQLTGVLSRPLDQLLHYPYPSRPIENFQHHEITITNYTGEARDYLKKLIAAMGAQFTPTMSPRNTVLVAADVQNGAKTQRALTWSIPIVNHLWLEDCFVQWRNLTVGLEKYIAHPPGLDFYTCLGKRGISNAVEDLEEIVKAELEEQEAAAELLGNGGGGRGMPPGTANSARDVAEVANYVEPDPMDFDDEPDRNSNHQDMDVDTPITPRKSPKKQHAKSSPSKKAPNSVSRSRHRKEAEEFNEEEEDPPEPRISTRVKGSGRATEKPLTPATRTKKNQKKVDDDIEMEEAEEEKENLNTRTRNGEASSSKTKPRSKKAAATTSDDELNRDDTPRTPRKKSLRMKVGHEETDADEQPSSDSTLTPIKSPPKRRRNENGEGPSHHTASISPTKSTVSVVVPNIKSINSSSSRSVAKTESIHVSSQEQSSRKRSSKAPIPSPSPPSPSLAEPTRGRRSAATKATQILHDQIMPDVLSYQQQMKNSKTKTGRKSLGAFSSVNGPDIPPSSSRRASTMHPDDEGESEVEALSSPGQKGKGRAGDKRSGEKPAKPKKGRKSTTDDTDGEEDASGTSRPAKRKSGSRKDRDLEEADEMETEAESTTRQPKKRKVEPGEEVRMMTTQVNLRDDVTKAMHKLGVKTASKPWDCTHLLVKSLVRTEKFLCAVAAGAHIVSEKWATDCASAKKILPEEKYILHDPDGEAKYNMNLKESLKRARKGREENNRLLERHVFYVTHHVQAEIRLLKNVITACGGTLASQTPTPRILDTNHELRHVISCPEDAKIWRPIAQKGYKIYTQELILTGVLRQEIEWDNEKWMVDGSF
ncbi:regulator of Ty1 Transposition [Marasmius tenuissimus]|nr:regulator of Ty1 Transposition [Marasmius tenuissimus]